MTHRYERRDGIFGAAARRVRFGMPRRFEEMQVFVELSWSPFIEVVFIKGKIDYREGSVHLKTCIET